MSKWIPLTIELFNKLQIGHAVKALDCDWCGKSHIGMITSNPYHGSVLGIDNKLTYEVLRNTNCYCPFSSEEFYVEDFLCIANKDLTHWFVLEDNQKDYDQELNKLIKSVTEKEYIHVHTGRQSSY